jgi:dephospho-CoA kinase
MLVERGAVLIDADELAREVVEPGTPGWSKVVEHFGREILLPDKRIDRASLAAIVFNDRGKLALLNEITHPEVMRRIADRLEELKQTDHIVIVDVPLLAEVGANDMFELIVVVTAPEAQQVERMRASRGMDEGSALARIAAQLSTADRASIADWLITNDASLDELAHEIDRLWDFLQAERGGRTTQ